MLIARRKKIKSKRGRFTTSFYLFNYIFSEENMDDDI